MDEVHTPLVIPMRANVWSTRARARSLDAWYTADTFLLRDAQFMSVCDRSKKSSGKTSVEGKNGRINFSSLVWDKGIAKTHDVCSALSDWYRNPCTLAVRKQIPNMLTE